MPPPDSTGYIFGYQKHTRSLIGRLEKSPHREGSVQAMEPFDDAGNRYSFWMPTETKPPSTNSMCPFT